MSLRQYLFLKESLYDLQKDFELLDQPLIIAVGDALNILQRLHKSFKISGLWSHQETWNDWTYQRDLRVKAWVKTMPFTWNEPSQHGVIRKLKDRDSWSSFWLQHMRKKLYNLQKS